MTRTALPTALLLLALAACAPPLEAPPIPAMPTERVPRPPAATISLIWQPGHYDWDGAAYHWIAGEWVPAQGRRLWQDGMWHRTGASWAWEPAHWL